MECGHAQYVPVWFGFPQLVPVGCRLAKYSTVGVGHAQLGWTSSVDTSRV